MTNSLLTSTKKDQKHDIKFAIASIRSLKKYDVDYIIVDKVYDTNKIIICINEEIKASNKIPLKSTFRYGWYRRLSIQTFKKDIYSRKNNLESVFSVIKRKYLGVNKSKSTRRKIKKQNLKHLFIILLKQSKFQKGFQHSHNINNYINE